MDSRLARLVVLSPFGVNPPRSGGHHAVLSPARCLARDGVEVHLFGLGVRRFEAFRHFRSFIREVERNLTEERLISWWNWLDYAMRGRSGLPPLGAGRCLEKRASAVLRRKCEEADVVQCESPWLFPFAASYAPVVLVAHNCEADLLPDGARGRAARPRVEEIEGRAWREADRVICLTSEDAGALASRYGEREAAVVPLGVDTERIAPPERGERERARRELGVADRFVVLFTGAWHLPNRRAAERIKEWSRDADETALYVVAGSVGERAERTGSYRATGTVPDLRPWFAAADCCVNPVTEGSGANVKLLEYLACGLPVVRRDPRRHP
ncbi:MAG: glycosyltransferase [Planctomycetota bacterium]|jgi:glycosyltransferase involved in cell wall biosynthesis